jgi:hypothetical protein
MAVVLVKEIWNGRNGGIDGQTTSALRRYVRVYRVVTNDANDGVYTAMTANDGTTSIPALWSAYSTPNESDAGAWVTDIRPNQSSQDPRFWEVQVQYDGLVNPLSQPPEIKWSMQQFSRIYELDINNEPLLNSAGQFFDPPPEGDDSRPTVEITLNQSSFFPFVALTYQDAINSDAVTIAGLSASPGTAKVASISGAYHQNLAFAWWANTYVIAFRRDGWAKKILDQGRYQLGTGGKPKPCVSDDGSTPVADPVPLDGSGAQLANPSPANAHYLTFDIYKELAFSALGLPT